MGNAKLTYANTLTRERVTDYRLAVVASLKSGICCVLRKETANQIKEGSLLIQGASDYDRDRGLVRFI